MQMYSEDETLDLLQYLVEGILLVSVPPSLTLCHSLILSELQVLFGAIGCVGNIMCIIIFSQKIVQKSFHHLMLSLAIFDLLYILTSIMLFGLPTLYPE